MELTPPSPMAAPLVLPPADEPAGTAGPDRPDPTAPEPARDDHLWRCCRERRPILDSEGYPIP